MNEHPTVVPSSRRGNTSGESQRRENRAARKGKCSPRGTETTVLTYPCPSQPCFGGSKECARVTGKARRAHPGQNRLLPSLVTNSRPKQASA